jgi:purine-binding chemotaxis protein CheW
MSATVVENAKSDVTTAQSLAGKYLTFALGNEEYGERVLKVREIIGMMDVTPVPQVPPHVKGVVNLRGKIIPVVDLRLKFGFEPQPYTERTCIVVVQVQREAGEPHGLFDVTWRRKSPAIPRYFASSERPVSSRCRR